MIDINTRAETSGVSGPAASHHVPRVIPAVSTGTPIRGPEGEPALAYDLEVFSNHILAVFTDGVSWWAYDETRFLDMAAIFRRRDVVLIGYNNTAYDDLLARVIAQNPASCTAGDLYGLSQQIIATHADHARLPEALKRLRHASPPWCYSIDLFKIISGGQPLSLKEHGCRMGAPLVAEAPVDFTKPLAEERRGEVLDYCRNDVETTVRLWHECAGLITTRRCLAAEYRLGRDVFACGDGRLSEMTLLALHHQKTGQTPDMLRRAAARDPGNARTSFNLGSLILPCIGFRTTQLQDDLELMRSDDMVLVGSSWTRLRSGRRVETSLAVAGVEIELGAGGLHSRDAPCELSADTTYGLYDLDATSFYPSIMVEHGISPPHMSPWFTDHLRALRDRRVKAKLARDTVTSDALKIVINAVFGKLNDQYSPLRSVPDALRVTLNGQLMLLMLMELLTGAGAEVLSMNTDGITVRWARVQAETRMRAVMADWTAATGVGLEVREYSRLVRRDVNSYVALGVDGARKTKGVFNLESRKRDGQVVVQAALGHLLDGADPADIIRGETSAAAFCYYQRVRGGGGLMLDDLPVGTLARWYVARTGGHIVKVLAGDKRSRVPHGRNARLAMDLRGLGAADLPDLDLQYYIDQAWQLIGAVRNPHVNPHLIRET